MMWEMLADVIAACLLGLPFLCLILLVRIDERVDKINCNLVYELERTRDHLRDIIRALSSDDDTDNEERYDV